MTAINKGDFIEIEFTGKVKDGDVFDSNIKEDLDKMNLPPENKLQAKPFIFCLGYNMFLKAIDEFLIGKQFDTGKTHKIELAPEKAFGKRDPKLIRIIPMKIFAEQKINPHPGMAFNFDNQLGKILSVSGGRVITDFNNPLAGKNVEYKIKVLGKIDDLNEKIKSLMDFFFRKQFKFEIKEKQKLKKQKKLILKLTSTEKPFIQLIDILKDKFKEILGLELEVEEIEALKVVNKEKQS